MKKIIATFFVLFLLLGCGESEPSGTNVKAHKAFESGEEIALKSVTGKPLTLVYKNGGFVVKGDENKVLMLDIFGTFCAPCKEEATNIMQYQIDHKDKFLLVALTHFENVTDEYVINEFMQKYNAFYFISNNQAINDRIIEQVMRDIGYQREIALPFKVVLKDGKYRSLTDIDSGKFGVKYYLGEVNMNYIKSDLEKIY